MPSPIPALDLRAGSGLPVLSLWWGTLYRPPVKPSMAEITERVAEKYGFTAETIRLARKKQGRLGEARTEAMALCQESGRSCTRVALYFNCRNHTTVVAAKARFAAMRAEVAA